MRRKVSVRVILRCMLSLIWVDTYAESIHVGFLAGRLILYCFVSNLIRVYIMFMRTAMTLLRLRGCTVLHVKTGGHLSINHLN